MYLSLPNHKKSAELVFLNLILTLISYRKIYQATYLLNVWRKS
ncbi:Positive transcriptional regulator, MutR family [Streptococcus thermophilus]|nr:Positive transcriptional regulator, MutR family [Streptococcus thermophilus]